MTVNKVKTISENVDKLATGMRDIVMFMVTVVALIASIVVLYNTFLIYQTRQEAREQRAELLYEARSIRDILNENTVKISPVPSLR